MVTAPSCPDAVTVVLSWGQQLQRGSTWGTETQDNERFRTLPYIRTTSVAFARGFYSATRRRPVPSCA
jgi:hypothetical protein